MKHFNLSVENFKQLALKNNFTLKEINQANDYYGGYRSVGEDGTSHRFVNTFSALNYLQDRHLKSYWCESDQVQMLKPLFQTSSSVEAFSLMQNSAYMEWVNTDTFPPGTPDSVVCGSERCVVDLTKPFDIKQLMDLKKLSNTKKDLDNPDQLKLFLTFLFYRGYFTEANSGGNKKKGQAIGTNKEIYPDSSEVYGEIVSIGTKCEPQERTLVAAVSGYLESSEVFRSMIEIKSSGRVYRPEIHAAVDAYVKHMLENEKRDPPMSGWMDMEIEYVGRNTIYCSEWKKLIVDPSDTNEAEIQKKVQNELLVGLGQVCTISPGCALL
uniref:Uncharacterized protein n=1 Tax=Ditylenchus dipsaci TaxID=166011 RepID=A0A915E4N4_9BILA